MGRTRFAVWREFCTSYCGKGPLFKENGGAWRMARIVLPAQQGHDEEMAERRFAMKEIEQDVLRTAGDYFAESPSLEERVARIEARDRVEELLAHYARCVDAQDAQGVGAAFAEDGEMCNPGMPALKGRARITKLYGKLLPELHTSSHLIGAQQVCLCRARGRWSMRRFKRGIRIRLTTPSTAFRSGSMRLKQCARPTASGAWRRSTSTSRGSLRRLRRSPA